MTPMKWKLQMLEMQQDKEGMRQYED